MNKRLVNSKTGKTTKDIQLTSKKSTILNVSVPQGSISGPVFVISKESVTVLRHCCQKLTI